MNIKKKLLLGMLVCIIITSSYFALFPSIQAAELTVSKTGSITSIQQAINQADSFDTIYVMAGLYIEQIIIDKTITLIGENKSNTTLSSFNNTCITIRADNVTIQGFTLQNSNQAIFINQSNNGIIYNNNIKNNSYGLVIDLQSNLNTIYHNNFVKNDVQAVDTIGNLWSQFGQGNYWDDYKGSDTNNNDIGDTSYIIQENISEDEYPLIKPLTLAPHAEFYFSPSDPNTQDMMVKNRIA